MSFTRPVDVEGLFRIADQDGDGVVGVEDARRFFAGAGLPGQALGLIWQAAVVQKGQRVLTRENFVLALLLASSAQREGSGEGGEGQTLGWMGGRAVHRSTPSDLPLPPPRFAEVTDSEWERYNAVFEAHRDAVTGCVSGATAAGLFSRFPVGRQTLSQIWDLADTDRDGALSRSEFAVTMALIAQATAATTTSSSSAVATTTSSLSGLAVVPEVVPSTLLASIKRHMMATASPRYHHPVLASSSSLLQSPPPLPSSSSSPPTYDPFLSSVFGAGEATPMPPMKPATTTTAAATTNTTSVSSTTTATSASAIATPQMQPQPQLFTSFPSQSLWEQQLFDMPAISNTATATTTATTSVLHHHHHQQQQQFITKKTEEERERAKADAETEAALARDLRAAQAVQAEVKAVRVRIAAKRARVAELQGQNRAGEGRCAGAEAGLAEAREGRAAQERQAAGLAQAAAEGRRQVAGMEEEAAALGEALRALERRHEELERLLAERTRALAAAGTRRASCVKILGEEKGKRAAAAAAAAMGSAGWDVVEGSGGGTAESVQHQQLCHQQVLPSGRVFGPGYVSRSNNSIDPFDFGDVVTAEGPDAWCYEPFEV